MAQQETKSDYSNTVKQSPSDDQREEYKSTKDFGFLPIPQHLRYDPDKPPPFGLMINIAFGLFSTFTASNLYYCQPLLIQLAQAFGASYKEVSRIPALVQAGYATGLVLISPLGDLLRRRPLLLTVVTISTALTIGLSVTSQLHVFEVLSFLVGAASVTPQILVPFAVDLAPAHRRSSAISIVLAGIILGILSARVFAGIIAEFRSYRVVYYYAVGVQIVVLVASYLIVPDYPRKNKNLSYWQILWTMAKFAVTEPVLVQGCLILICLNGCFSNFWVTLTFLLAGPPYHFSTLGIGLFGLVGIFGVLMGPLGGRVLDRLVPWYGSLISVSIFLLVLCIQFGAGGINIGAVVVAAFGIDIFNQMIQVAVTTAIYGISAEARSRLNALAILSIFIGQVMGTSVGSLLFLQHGWRAGAGFSVGLAGCMIAILLVRGPHTERHTWFGYQGGMEWRKQVPEEKTAELEESKQPSPDASCVETMKAQAGDGEVVEATSSSGDQKIRSQESGRSMA